MTPQGEHSVRVIQFEQGISKDEGPDLDGYFFIGSAGILVDLSTDINVDVRGRPTRLRESNSFEVRKQQAGPFESAFLIFFAFDEPRTLMIVKHLTVEEVN